MRSTQRPRPADDGTRQRLLEAAAHTVADHGFAGTTVRAICRRARANVAAVNYHFGSKDDLVAQALRWCAASMPEDPWFRHFEPGDPREDLRTAVRAFAHRLLGAHDEWRTRLMVRAITETNPALDLVVREVAEPRLRALEAVIRSFRPRATARELRLTAVSVVSQIAYYRVAAPFALRLVGERAVTQRFADEIAEHVAAFTERSLASGAGVARGPGKESQT
jgi:AcrR family transcriptional regulator